VIEDTCSSADGVAIESRHGKVIDEGSAKFHGIGHALIGSSLNQGDEARASPGDDVSISAGVGNLFHVGGEVSGSGRCEDIISHKFGTQQGTGIAEGFGGAVSKSMINSQLDEGLVILGQGDTFVHGVLIVVAAGAEGVLVEVDTGDVIGSSGCDDQGHLGGLGNALEHSGGAGGSGTDEEVDLLDIDQLIGNGSGRLRIAGVIANVDNDLTIINLECVFLSSSEVEHIASSSRGAGRVFHPEHEGTNYPGAVALEDAGQVGDQTDFDRFGTGQTCGNFSRFFDRSFGSLRFFHDLGWFLYDFGFSGGGGWGWFCFTSSQRNGCNQQKSDYSK